MPDHDSRPALLGGQPAVAAAAPPWPLVDDEVVREVTRIITEETLCPVGAEGTQGEFERAFAEMHGRKYGLAVNGGTAALMLALHGAGVQPGDEVIVSPFTWGASVSCVLQNFAIPIFADIDPDTFTLDPDSIESRITERTKAIVVVHLFGFPADMTRINEVAARHGLAVIEDCAQSHGGKHAGRYLGSWGTVGAFSLQASKNLTGGEGGILICDDREVLERAMSMGTHPQRLQVELELPEYRRKIDSLAFNYRMHTMSAAMANVQLKYLEGWTVARGRNARRLYDGVRDLECLRIPPALLETDRHAYYHIPFTYVPGVIPLGRDEWVAALKAEGVNMNVYVRVPLYLRPRFQEHDYFGRGYPWALSPVPIEYRKGDCPVAEAMGKVEFQVAGNYYVDVPELMDQVAGAMHRVAASATALRAHFDANPLAL
ncbi:MAG: DegT/DnrJ/EryC1/StrS family aminotransferase [Dehalococcoidia bacterium]